MKILFVEGDLEEAIVRSAAEDPMVVVLCYPCGRTLRTLSKKVRRYVKDQDPDLDILLSSKACYQFVPTNPVCQKWVWLLYEGGSVEAAVEALEVGSATDLLVVPIPSRPFAPDEHLEAAYDERLEAGLYE